MTDELLQKLHGLERRLAKAIEQRDWFIRCYNIAEYPMPEERPRQIAAIYRDIEKANAGLEEV